jgi:hypothetical protein
MLLNINQVAPLDNFAGLQQYVTIDQGGGAGTSPGAQSISGLPQTPDLTAAAGTSTAIAGFSLGQWIFAGAVAYWFFFYK